MAFSYGFFDAKNRDRTYTAEDFTGYLSSLICNGILDTYGQCFKVTAHNNLSVTIGSGKAWINGHYFENDSDYTLDLSSYVSTSQGKYAAIGICCDTSNDVRACSIIVKAGSTVPTFFNSGSQTYLTLASVHLSVGTQTVVNGDITDYRNDDKKCGYVRCILGKCGVSELMEQLASLEQRAVALERQLGLANNGHRVIVHKAMSGLPSLMGEMGHSVNGLMGIVGSLETIKMEDE